ncbi:MAG: translocation/assembly module TamB domain-containing protein [Flavobacteriales bacterium]|nr:translocation/assembly module TamB domain-containing protein [Flavobacteriales bacterium]
MVLPSASVQTWIAQKVLSAISDDLGFRIKVDRLRIGMFGPSRFDGVLVTDLQGDTLFAAGRLKVDRWRVHPRSHHVSVGALFMRDARFRLDRPGGAAHSNLTDWIAALGSGDTTASGPPWVIQCRTFDIQRFHFSYDDHGEGQIPYGVDFDHVDVHHADVRGRDLVVIDDSVRAQLDHVAFKERSGLVLDHMDGNAQVSGRGIIVDGLQMVTPNSAVRGDLAFRTMDWSDYDRFTDAVDFDLALDTSKVCSRDIAFFAPPLEGLDVTMEVRGDYHGTVADLKGRNVDIGYGRETRFTGSIEMNGLPVIANTFIILDIDRLTTVRSDIASLPIAPFTSGEHMQVPAELEALGPIVFRGNFTGFINSFTAFGRASSDLGILRADISFDRDTISRVFELEGELATDGFDPGPLLRDPTLGPIACDLRLHAKGNDLASMRADLDGKVPMLTVNDHVVSGIRLNGRLERRLFNGHLECDDPVVQLVFDGLADLRGTWPKVDFTATVSRADLYELKLLPRAHLGEVSFRMKADGELAPDSLKGTLQIMGLEYCDEDSTYLFGDLALASGRVQGMQALQLRSGLADIDVHGDFLPTRLPTALRSVLFSVFPALSDQVEYALDDQRFTFDVRVKDIDPLLHLTLPDLRLDPGAVFEGRFDSRTFDVGLTADLPYISYAGLGSDSVHVILDKTLDVLALSFRSKRQDLSDSTYITGIDITGKAYQDELELRMAWAGSTNNTSGELDLQGQVLGPDRVTIDMLPSRLYFGRGVWRNPQVATFLLDSSALHIQGLELVDGRQKVRVDGALSRDPAQAIAFELHDFRLENARPFYTGPTAHGSLSGDGRLFDPFGTPYFFSYLCLDSLAVNDRPVGDIRFSAQWSRSDRAMQVSGQVLRDTLKALDFSGRVVPTSEKEQLDLELDLDQFDLAFLDPYLPGEISDIQGQVTGKVHVGGTFAVPLVEGNAFLKDAGLRIAYLNTFYHFTHEVRILPDMFTLDFVKLIDEEGHEASAIGTIIHHGFTDWNFDITLGMDRFLCMNTTGLDNELYYGKAYATGDLQVSGYTDNLQITLDAKADKGTVISLPLGSSTEVSGIDFVRFHAGDLWTDTADTAVDLSGIDLDMNVEVTPDARFELIFDPTVGDILSGSGRGNIQMQVTPSGEFKMRGDMEVTDGQYLFTLRRVVNKRFDVEPGGHITWYGDPFDAQLALDAVYRLRAPLYDIIPDERTDAYTKRVPVEVLMHLTDRLENPDIGFDIRLPSVDEGTRTQVNSLLSDKDELDRQAFALIVLNRFLPVDRFGQGDANSATGSNVVGTTGSELLSNQVSNWLSQLSNDVDLGVNYRPGDALTQDELELAVSTQLFNERLLLSTNVGVQYGTRSSAQGNTLVGDFALEYLLTDDGKLRLKAFSQSNDRNLNQVDQAPTTQGAGLTYREEFDDARDLWRRFKSIFTRRKDTIGDQ